VIFSIIQFLIIHRHRYYAPKSNKRQIYFATCRHILRTIAHRYGHRVKIAMVPPR
jgi:hypothetical protein